MPASDRWVDGDLPAWMKERRYLYIAQGKGSQHVAEFDHGQLLSRLLNQVYRAVVPYQGDALPTLLDESV